VRDLRAVFVRGCLLVKRRLVDDAGERGAVPHANKFTSDFALIVHVIIGFGFVPPGLARPGQRPLHAHGSCKLNVDTDLGPVPT
jgi:hypothetical protein